MLFIHARSITGPHIDTSIDTIDTSNPLSHGTTTSSFVPTCVMLVILTTHRYTAGSQVKMPTLGDIRVIISVDKQNRTDYHDEDTAGQDAKFISRYVECKSAASFSVDISIKKTTNFKSDAIVFRVYIDGHDADGVVIAKADVSSTSGAVYFHRSSGATRKIADSWEFRPFMFGEIKHGKLLSEANG